MTFRDAEVEKALSGLAVARIEVDEQANVDVCRRLHGNEGVPTFVLLDTAGAELHRWVGGGDAARFLGELRVAGDEVARAAGSAIEHHGALVEFYLRRNDAAQVAEQMRAIERLDPERRSATFENALWSLCRTARQCRNWGALRAAALRYLELPGAPRADQVRPLLGIAEFETSRTMMPELQRYIDERIAVLGTPAPGSSIGERLQRWLGSDQRAEGAVREWVGRQNEAMDELGGVGAAAAASLRDALLHDATAAQRAGVVLARLRLAESTPWLVERLADPATPAWAHLHLVSSIGMHKEQRCLPVLLGLTGVQHPVAVRSQAVDGIKSLLVSTDGTTRQDVADAMAQALESRPGTARRSAAGAVLRACAHAARTPARAAR